MQFTNLPILVCVFFTGSAFCQITVPIVINVPTGMTSQTVAAGNDPRLGNVLYDYGVAANNAITDRVANLTAGTLTYDIFSAGDFSYGSYFTRNTALWAADLDLTCFSPWNSTGLNTQAGTLITPKHVLLASHFSDPGYVISAVTIGFGGTGYTSPPTVAFSGGGAVYQPPASVQVNISGGSVTYVHAEGTGYGYTSPPTVTFSGGGGSGAMASCTIAQAGSSPMTAGVTVMKFVDNNNVVYTRTLTAFYKVPPPSTGDAGTDADTDALIGTLDSPLPASVSYAHVLSYDADNVNYFPAGALVAYSNQLKELHLGVTFSNPGTGFANITTGSLAAWSTPVIVGDSGSPTFLYVNGNWDLLFCLSGPEDGPDVSSLAGNINAYMFPYALTVDALKTSGSLANVNPHGYYNSASGVPAATLTGANTQPVGTVPPQVPVKTSVVTALPASPTVNGVGSEVTYAGSWGYQVVARAANGQASMPSAVGLSASPTFPFLNLSNYMTISVAGSAGSTYDFYRVQNQSAASTPSTFGYIGSAAVSGGVASINDTGLSASGSVPTVNNSGVIFADNAIHWISPRTANYTPHLGEGVPVDTTSGAVTITLPTAPPDGAAVDVKWIAGSSAVTVACGGSDVFNKSGGSATGTLSTLNQTFHLCYATSFGGWVIQDSLALSSLDARYATAAQGALAASAQQPTASGAGLTSLTAANITGTHTLPDGVLSTNVPLLNGSPTFTGPFSVLPAAVTTTSPSAVNISAGSTNNASAFAVGGAVNIAGGNETAGSGTSTYGGPVILNGGTGPAGNGTVNIGGSNTSYVHLGAAGTATLVDGVLQLHGYTVSTLPSGAVGQEAYVTDATAPTYNGTLTGGGAVTCLVFYNGTAWKSQ